MRKSIWSAYFCFGVCTSLGIAQTVTTAGGTQNAIPKFSGSFALSGSAITEVNGNIGIGTISPTHTLTFAHVSPFNQNLSGNDNVLSTVSFRNVSADAGATFTDAAIAAVQPTGYFADAGAITFSTSFGSLHEHMRIMPDGNIGIGTASPNSKLEVANGTGRVWNASGLNWPLTSLTQSAYIELSQHISDDNTGTARILAYSNGLAGIDNYGQAAGLAFQTSSTDAAPTTKVVIDEPGNVGIGTTTPGAKLDVAGDIKLSGGGASITFPDGSRQSVAWNGTLCGGDYAESVDVSGDRTHYEPGDVLVIDPTQPGKFLKSNKPYSRLVAGIYSTKPGVLGRRQASDPKTTTAEVPMAMVGIVPAKVTTESGPIEVGDLLVTSSLEGYAMKGTDEKLPTGSVLGKALGSLASGTGVIEVLVSLQ